MQKLDINLKPSKQFIFLMLLVLTSAVLLVVLLPIPLGVRLFLEAIILSYGFYVLTYHGLLKHKQSIYRLTLTDSKWLLWDKSGEYSAELCGSSTISTQLCLLRFRMHTQHNMRSCLIFVDSVDADIFRKILFNIRGWGGV